MSSPHFPCLPFAFPTRVCIDPINDTYAEYPGITIRDYFAAKAMQGLLNSASNELDKRDPHGLVARAAYKMADAMMEARK